MKTRETKLATILIILGTTMIYYMSVQAILCLLRSEAIGMSLYAISIGGLGLTLCGCYLWTRAKNRHFAHMFWGLITPLGLIVLYSLKDKSKQQRIVQEHTEPNYKNRMMFSCSLGFAGIIVAGVLLGHYISGWFYLLFLALMPTWKYGDYCEDKCFRGRGVGGGNPRPFLEILGGCVAMVIVGTVGIVGEATSQVLLIVGIVFGIVGGIAVYLKREENHRYYY